MIKEMTTHKGCRIIIASLFLAVLAPFRQAHGSVKYLDQPFGAVATGAIGICSFNIQWLGHWMTKANQELANLVKNCDVIAIQELVAPPWDVKVRGENGLPLILKGDKQSLEFVEAMKNVGLDGVMLGTDNTGPNRNHINTPAAEWPLLFYKTSRIKPNLSLPSGFIADKLAGNPVFSRVPYAFGLSTIDNNFDFVVISVHLFAYNSTQGVLYSKARRVAEFQVIAGWIEWQKDNHISNEKDYFVMGDMNLEDVEEYDGFFGDVSVNLKPFVSRIFNEQEKSHGALQKLDYKSMNSSGSRGSEHIYPTNIGLNKPFDHIMYDEINTTADMMSDLEVVDIAKFLKLSSFPTSRAFIQQYSDHNPIRMQIKITTDKD